MVEGNIVYTRYSALLKHGAEAPEDTEFVAGQVAIGLAAVADLIEDATSDARPAIAEIAAIMRSFSYAVAATVPAFPTPSAH